MKYGLIGYPIAHSKSPELFRAAYPEADSLPYDLIEEDDFEKAYRRFLDGYDAVNVTAPYKGNAFRKVDVADTISRELFAVNILKKKDGKTSGRSRNCWNLMPTGSRDPGCWSSAAAARRKPRRWLH